ncbi:polyamine oxidase (exo-N4-amino) 1 [Chanos chanos]|uniref:Polyamine oxidase (Exo-N4-amino) 1 n=1 Tax=Chanos chanos TaxID=29144 RepID=A0A6J2WA40_CHACN|nr:peroxisomal N(1)-acetyl-spermine/spermidine oxidase-like [Chanos chanos]
MANPRIVVVGAGMAGIGVATKLRELGFNDVTLVEAAGEPGGRVAKSSLGKSWVDTGAQYIHGASKANPVYCLLKKSGLLDGIPKEEGTVVTYTGTGNKLDPRFAEHLFEEGEAMLKYRGSNSEKSLGEHLAEQALAFIENWQGDDEEKRKVQRVLVSVGKQTLTSIGATDLNKVSLSSWQYYKNMGEDLDVAGSMFQLVDILLEDFPKDQLLLSKAVCEIDWDGSFSSENGREYPVRIGTENGEDILADHVVVTISLGCLKSQASTLFRPQLPEEKLQVIDKLGFGNLAKIFLEYEEAFWGSDVEDIRLISEESFPHLHHNPDQWLKSLEIFTVLKPKKKFGNVLIGWCSGTVADLIETMSEEELSKAITERLRTYTGNASIPPPKTVLYTRWHNNKLTQGAYAFLPVGVSGLVMDILAQPLSSSKNSSQDLQVLFAGEATIKSLYGTVHGALLSGYREAERLALHYNRTVTPGVLCDT